MTDAELHGDRVDAVCRRMLAQAGRLTGSEPGELPEEFTVRDFVEQMRTLGFVVHVSAVGDGPVLGSVPNVEPPARSKRRPVWIPNLKKGSTRS